MCRVVLVGVPGDERTQQAREQLTTVPGLEQSFYPCQASVEEAVRLPLVREETGRAYFGLPAIESFVADQRSLLGA